jgi:hypothetical protein
VAPGYDLAKAESSPEQLLGMLATGPDLSTAAAKAELGEVTNRVIMWQIANSPVTALLKKNSMGWAQLCVLASDG